MKIRTADIAVGLMFFFMISSVSMGKQLETWKGKIEQKDGLQIIKNPKDPAYPENTLKLEEDLAIASPDNDLRFQRLNYLAVDDAENIYVSDSYAGHILVFNKNGEFVRKIGQKGRGPGEMMFPLEIQILANNELLVNDTGQTRAHIFNLDGAFVRQMTTSQLPGFRLPKADSAGNIVVGLAIPGEPFQAVLRKFDSELNPICDIASLDLITRPPVIAFFEMRWRTNLVWNVSKDDQIIWGNFNKYEIFVCDPDGKCIRKIFKEHDGVPITKEKKEKMIKGYFGNRGVPSSVKLKFPDTYPPFVYLTSDEEGRIFALSYATIDEDGTRYLDVFNSEGEYIAQTQTRSFPQAWKNNRMYSVDDDEEGLAVIKRYRVKFPTE